MLISLMNHQLAVLTVLVLLFFLALVLNKKIIGVLISILFLLLGAFMFVLGFGAVQGWEGMGVTMAGIIYGAIGLITSLIMSFVAYFSAKKESKSLDSFK